MKTKKIFENKKIHIVILAVLAALIYSISWHYEMYPQIDDGRYILRNEHLAFNLQNITHWLTQPYIGLYIPVTAYSFMFDYAFWGFDPMGYHLQNTFWFIVTIIAIYACFIKMKLKPWHAFVLLLIYTVHPQRVESVVWVTERKDVLSGAFFFIALFFFLNKFKKDKFSFLAFIAYIIAILSKPMAVTLPAVLIMIDFSRNRQFSPKYYIKRYWLYALVVIINIIMILNIDFIKMPSDDKRMLSVMLFNIYWYIKSAFMPNFYNMSVLYPKLVFSWQIITQMLIFYILLIASGIICFLKMKKETLLYSVLPLVLCYIAVLSPVMGGFTFSSPDYADRYNYIPSVFLLFAAGCVVPLIINERTKRVVTLSITVYVIILTYSTIMFLPHWKNSISVYAKSCEHRPANILSVLALSLLEADLENYDKALILADRLQKDYLNDDLKMPGIAHAGELYIKATVLYKTGEKARALRMLNYISNDKFLLKFVRERFLGSERLYVMQADCYLQKRMPGKAILCFKKLVKLKDVAPKNILFYKGMIAFFENRKQEALSYFEKAHQLDTEDKNIKYNLQRIRKLLKQQNNN